MRTYYTWAKFPYSPILTSKLRVVKLFLWVATFDSGEAENAVWGLGSGVGKTSRTYWSPLHSTEGVDPYRSCYSPSRLAPITHSFIH